MIFSKLFKRSVPKTKSENLKGQTTKKIKVKSTRIGELGEYKINIQLDQFSKDWKHVSDLMIVNDKSKSGYSQIDHVVITPFGLFVIETKNYAGKVSGRYDDKYWIVNGKFKMYNPFRQNYGHIKAIQKSLLLDETINVYSMVSFTQRCMFNVEPALRKITSDHLIIYDTELTEYINRKISILKVQEIAPCLNENEVTTIFNKLKNANITDLAIRKEHIDKAKQASENNSKTTLSTHKCYECGTKVSEKVEQYCLLNSVKFKGKIYCFTHQKNL